MSESKHTPFEVNRFECGCRIYSELRGGLGAKLIEYCPLHEAAPDGLKLAKAVLVHDEDTARYDLLVWEWWDDIAALARRVVEAATPKEPAP